MTDTLQTSLSLVGENGLQGVPKMEAGRQVQNLLHFPGKMMMTALG